MNKIITIRTLVLLFLFITLKANAQDINFTATQINNPNVLPPDVSSFQKVNFLPVSNYTGRANIEIPFYEINLGGLKIPIGLSYNTGGVKPNDVASSVGQNWSLNAGGVISKTTNGIDDFYHDYSMFHDYETGEDIYYGTSIGYLSYYSNHIAPFGFPGADDTQPDTFNVTAPGIGFSFIHNRGKNDPGYGPSDITSFSINQLYPSPGENNQNGQPFNDIDTNPLNAAPFILDGSNDYKIDETYGDIVLGMFGVDDSFVGGGLNNRYWLYADGSFNPNYKRYGINSISIKNNNGFQYIFDKIDSSQYLLNRDKNEVHIIGGTTITNYHSNVNLTSYHLSKIIDSKTGRTVEFQYETYSQSFSEIMDNNLTSVNYPPDYTMVPKGEWLRYPKLNRIKKIIFDEGYINFNYNLNRDDVPGEKALSEIVLFDSKNNQIRKAILNFEYFQSAVQQSSPFSKRLKLKDVTMQGSTSTENQKYSLTYNTTNLPLRTLSVTDFFGYNNGAADYFQNFYNISTNNYSTGNMPNPIGYFHPNNGQNSFLPIQLNPNALLITGNYSLAANLNYCKAGILERIDYPTGGYSSLDYELNTFQLNNVEIVGGGLRVKEQKISDGTNTRTLKFEYKKSDNTSSGAVASMSKFIDFDYNANQNAPLQSGIPSNITPTQFNTWFSLAKTNYSKGNIELTNGCYVGYSDVKVFENNKGYTLYKYSNPSTHPNVQADVVFMNPPLPMFDPYFSNTNNYKKIYYDNGKIDLNLDNDVYRGKLLKESIFNTQNTLLKETTYSYTEKLFKNMLMIKFFDNTIHNERETPDHILGSWLLSRQYINFKQRRYMLTGVTENEYFNGTPITTNKTLEYHDNYSLIKKTTIADNLNTYATEYYYPFDALVQSDFGMSSLVQNNRIGEKILTYSFKNNEKLLEEKVLYNNFSSVLPKQFKKFKSSSTGNTNEINSLEVTNRDAFGNICETKDALGNKIAYIWGYNNTKIIAKLENTSYSSISYSLVSDLQGTSTTGTESQLDTRFIYLRTLMPNSFITTYSYKPLIGVSTITDTKGDKAIYEYDVFGRLKAVRDKNNNILSENEYHYKS